MSTNSGNSVIYSEGFSVSFQWEVGGDIGVTIEDILDIGVSGGISELTTSSTSEAGTVDCPSGGSWQCAALITPSYTTAGRMTSASARSPVDRKVNLKPTSMTVIIY